MLHRNHPTLPAAPRQNGPRPAQNISAAAVGKPAKLVAKAPQPKALSPA